jgi:hypothetical protein
MRNPRSTKQGRREFICSLSRAGHKIVTSLPLLVTFSSLLVPFGPCPLKAAPVVTLSSGAACCVTTAPVAASVAVDCYSCGCCSCGCSHGFRCRGCSSTWLLFPWMLLLSSVSCLLLPWLLILLWSLPWLLHPH